MDPAKIKCFLFWNIIINIGLLLFWFIIVSLAEDFVYKIHSKFMKISRESFHSIHYAGVMFYKILISIFLVIPYISLMLVK